MTLSGLQLFDSDLLWALGAMTDAVAGAEQFYVYLTPFVGNPVFEHELPYRHQRPLDGRYGTHPR